jgi:polar amino acid transport system substrate-binding protein
VRGRIGTALPLPAGRESQVLGIAQGIVHGLDFAAARGDCPRRPPSRARFATLAAAWLCALGLVAAADSGARTLDEIRQDGGRILLATEGKFPPFNVFKGAQLSGFEVELAELVTARMGLTHEWKAIDFNGLLTGLQQNRWDLVIASHGITEERSKAVTFADPHYCSGGVIVSTNPAISTAHDLAGKVIAVQTGTTYLENARRIPGLKEIKNFPQDTDARSALMTGRVDAWVTDRFTALEVIKTAPGAGMRIGEFLFVDRLAAAVAKGNTSLAQAWNAALAQTMKDGSYAALSNKYFGQDVRCK